MSKYTTEVRFICEQKAGREESAGFSDVDQILEESWNKIFTTKAKIFDEEYRPVICKKILKHYYTREIGAETAGLWQLWLNTKMEEILPYYNMLWESALLEFDPFNDVDYKKTHEGEADGTKMAEGSSSTEETKVTDQDGTTSNTVNGQTSENFTGSKAAESEETTHDSTSGEVEKTGTDTDTVSGRITDAGTYADLGTVTNAREIEVDATGSSTASKGDRYSDTPQGTISNTDVTGNAYLTNVRLIDDSGSETSSSDTSDTNTETRNLNGTSGNTRTEATTVTKGISETTESSETATGSKTVESSETDRNQKAGTSTETATGSSTNDVTETGTSSTDTTNNETQHNTDSYIDHVFGKMSTTPYAELLQKFRDTFMNIDLLVIEEFDELFLRLW